MLNIILMNTCILSGTYILSSLSKLKSLHSLNIVLLCSCITIGQEVWMREVSRATRSVIWACDLITNLHLNLSHVIEWHDGQHGKDANRVSDRTADKRVSGRTADKRPIFLTHGGAAETAFLDDAVDSLRSLLSTFIAARVNWTHDAKTCTYIGGIIWWII